MLKQHNGLVVFKAYGEEDGGTQEPGAQVPIHETPEFQEALKAELAKAVAAETGGLKSKNSEILAEKKKVQDQLNAILAQAEDEQDQAALKSGKMDFQALLDKRVNAANATWQERLQAEQAEKDELRKAVDAGNGRLKQFKIKQLIGNEALKNEFFQPSAIDDLINLAGGAWELTDNDELVSRDQHGNVAMGKSGRALTPKEWIESLTQTKQHYFKPMPGSGGKQGTSGAGKIVSLGEWQNMIMLADSKTQGELFAKKAKGEIVIG
jgi:FtsZ-binding cell division protein ZapB